MSDDTGPGRSTAPSTLGRRHLQLADIVAQSVGFMGPVFSAVLLIPLVAGAGASGEGAGAASPVALVLAAIGVFAIGWIISRFARRIHAAGALYEYVTDALGQGAGFLAGWVYYMGATALASAIVVLIGGFTADYLSSAYGVSIPYITLDFAYAVILFLLLYLGVQVSTRAQLALVGVSFLVVLAFVVYIIALGGHTGNSARPFDPGAAPHGWLGILYGILYGVLLFTGFESAANLAEETHQPRKFIPRAVLLAVTVVGFYYVIASYGEVLGFGLNGKAFAANSAPLLTLGGAGQFGSSIFADVLQVLVILDMAAVGLGTAVAATRGLFALARDGRLPSPLAVVSRRHSTPLGSTLLVVGIGVSLAVAVRLDNGIFSRATPGSSALQPQYFPMFAWLAGLGGFCVVLVYGAICIGGLVRSRLLGHPGAVAVAGVIGLAVSGGAIFGAIYKVSAPSNLIPVVVGCWLGLGAVVGVVLWRRGRLGASGPAEGATAAQAVAAGAGRSPVDGAVDR